MGLTGPAGLDPVPVRGDPPRPWLAPGAFAAFVFYECATLPWASITSGGDGDPILGAVAVLCLLTATAMLLFAVFDGRPVQGRRARSRRTGHLRHLHRGSRTGYPYGR